MPGILISEGMSLLLPKLTLTLNEKGELSGNIELEVSYDACTAWARIALFHRDDAIDKMNIRRSAWSSDGFDGNDRNGTLENEFLASTQAVVSAAICMDALYDHLINISPITKETRRSWRQKKTARHAQISETIRASFDVKQSHFAQIRRNIHAIFALRDKAVHPSNTPQPPHLHPELDTGVDWRFAAFRGDVADLLVTFTLSILWDISHLEEYKSKEIKKFSLGLTKRIEKMLPEGRPSPNKNDVNIYIPGQSF